MKKRIFTLLFLSLFFVGCSNQFNQNTGFIYLTVPFGNSSREAAISDSVSSGETVTEKSEQSFHCTFDFVFADSSKVHREADSGETVALTSVPVGNCSIEVNAYLPEIEAPVYKGSTTFTVIPGENPPVKITLKKVENKAEEPAEEEIVDEKEIIEVIITIPEGVKLLVNEKEKIDWSTVKVQNVYDDGSKDENASPLSEFYDIQIDTEIVKNNSYVGYIPVLLKSKVSDFETEVSIPMFYSLAKGNCNELGVKAKIEYFFMGELPVVQASCSTATVNYIDEEGNVIAVVVPMSVTSYELVIDGEITEAPPKYGYYIPVEFYEEGGEHSFCCSMNIIPDVSYYPDYLLFTQDEIIVKSETENFSFDSGDDDTVDIWVDFTDVDSSDDSKLIIGISYSSSCLEMWGFSISLENITKDDIYIFIDGEKVELTEENLVIINEDDFQKITLYKELDLGMHSVVICIKTETGLKTSEQYVRVFQEA